jgi:hypothetical protein
MRTNIILITPLITTNEPLLRNVPLYKLTNKEAPQQKLLTDGTISLLPQTTKKQKN